MCLIPESFTILSISWDFWENWRQTRWHSNPRGLPCPVDSTKFGLNWFEYIGIDDQTNQYHIVGSTVVYPCLSHCIRYISDISLHQSISKLLS